MCLQKKTPTAGSKKRSDFDVSHKNIGHPELGDSQNKRTQEKLEKFAAEALSIYSPIESTKIEQVQAKFSKLGIPTFRLPRGGKKPDKPWGAYKFDPAHPTPVRTKPVTERDNLAVSVGPKTFKITVMLQKL